MLFEHGKKSCSMVGPKCLVTFFPMELKNSLNPSASISGGMLPLVVEGGILSNIFQVLPGLPLFANN